MSLLYVPCATPSGFSMGTSLNTNLCRRVNTVLGGGRGGGEAALAAQVAGGGAGAQQEIDEAAGDVRVTGDTPRHSSHTSHRIIHEALGSPGCTRAVMTATVFASKGEESAGGEGWGPSRGGLRGRKGPVMVTRSQGMRQGDRHRHDTCTCSFP